MRLTIGLIFAILVNLGLFTVMQNMTSSRGIERLVLEDLQLLDFVRLQRDTRTNTKKRELPKKPPPPEKPSPLPKALAPQIIKPKVPAPKLEIPRIDVPLNIVGAPYLGDFSNAPIVKPQAFTMSMIDDDVIPLLRIPPKYPRIASRRGIEGVVTISFMITKQGEVRDPIIVRAKPENIFNKSALKAIKKWKFKPKIVGGQSVERQATQEIEFKLAQ